MFRQILSSVVLLAILSACASGQRGTAVSYDACLTAPDAVCVAQLAAQEARAMPAGPARADAAMEAAIATNAADLMGLSAELLSLAEADVLQVIDSKKKAALLVKLATTAVEAGANQKASEAAGWALQATSALEGQVDKVDITGKALVVYAKLGAFDAAVQRTARLAEDPATAASFKARTYHDIAPLQAKAADFAGAEATLNLATMGLQYYPASARTDVATLAYQAGEQQRADRLLQEAISVGRGLDDAYFVAGTLRHAAESYSLTGRDEQARTLYLEAIDRVLSATAENGAGPGTLAAAIQSRARAISRVATAQAESGFKVDAVAALEQAQGLAASEPSEPMRNYANYEIAGSMAFAGAFDQAASLIATLPETPFGDAQSLQSAALRDLAWAKAVQGDVAGGLADAQSISTVRERVAALGRISRALANPGMRSGPRYL